MDTQIGTRPQIGALEIITMLDLLLKLNVMEKYVSIPTQQIFEVVIE